MRTFWAQDIISLILAESSICKSFRQFLEMQASAFIFADKTN